MITMLLTSDHVQRPGTEAAEQVACDAPTLDAKVLARPTLANTEGLEQQHTFLYFLGWTFFGSR